MTEHQTLNTVIHAAFRRDLRRFDDALGAFPAGSRHRAAELGRAWDNYALQLHHHHQDEETIFWPALRELGVDVALMVDLEGEHETMTRALENAESTMASFVADPSASSTAAARAALATLQETLDAHLAHEERDLEPLAVSHLKTRQMKVAAGAVRKAHQGGSGTFLAWLADGADAEAMAFMRHDIPPPVLFAVTRIGGRRYTREIAPVWRQDMPV